ncbi:TPA: enoyl-CoA hydratase, partial [Mannheimia haemolytica]|nr:enoyl-CoA hydratase [Mannheimia haemolytica]HDL5188155.1 enoyl-CoA hydratase [Mannheimia haemolytica]
YFAGTKGKPYDWRGVFGIVLGIKQKRDKYFCSEWCFNLIKQSDEGWRFSPNQLVAIFKKG